MTGVVLVLGMAKFLGAQTVLPGIGLSPSLGCTFRFVAFAPRKKRFPNCDLQSSRAQRKIASFSKSLQRKSWD